MASPSTPLLPVKPIRYTVDAAVDPYYGTHTMECIGIVDFKAKLFDLEQEVSDQWTHKFHPVSFFGAYFRWEELFCHTTRGVPDSDRPCLAVLVYTKRVNLEWDFKASEYSQHVSRKPSGFPLNVNDRKIARWQHSLPDQYLIPDWLLESGAESIEELKAIYRARHAHGCPYCT